MLGRYILILITLNVVLTSAPIQAAERYAALIVDAKTDRVLFAQNADAVRHPASLTKMMTLYMVFDALESRKLTLNSRLSVSQRAAAQPRSKLDLKAGETITVKQAILALITRSANDVATVVAEALGKTETQFAQLMTQKAHALGMKNTQFRNASGLHNPSQFTTAWDMYRLAKALQSNFPQYYPFFSTKSFIFQNAKYRNHNGLLKNYSGTDGIKTGYIRASGFNLVSSVKREDHHLIGIVFGGHSSQSRDRHMRTLLDQAFSHLEKETPVIASIVLQPLQLISNNSAFATNPTVSHPVPTIANNVISDKTLWTVQVGAFSQAKTAEDHTSKALLTVPQLLSKANVIIDPLVRDGRTIYRARFNGLNQREARNACQLLQQRNIDCILVPPSTG